MKLRLRVLPTLVDSLKAVSIRIKNICGVIPRIIVWTRSWLTVIYCSSFHCSFVKSINLFRAIRNEAHMCCTSIYYSPSEPEKHSPIATETF